MTPVEIDSSTRNCPKCGTECATQAAECPSCQIIFGKFADVEDRRNEAIEDGKCIGDGHSIERLALVDRLLVKQQFERLEAWTSWEVANAYSVLDGLGNVLFYVAEESGTLGRQLLKCMRPFTMHVTTPDGRELLTLRRPYRFYFTEINVHDANGLHLGTVRKRFSLINRRYDLVVAASRNEYEIFGPFFRPWTFGIRKDGVEQGTIRKKWSGALREIFTDADTFGVEFPRELDIRAKAVFLGAVFLIDFMHFEDNNDD